MTYVLHRIGKGKTSNFNTPEEVAAQFEKEPDALYTFDGPYRSVYLHRELFHGLKQRPILFVVGAHVGGDNAWDDGEPFGRFCDWNEIMLLATQYNFRIGWHTWTHPDLATCTPAQLRAEVAPPEWLRCDAFAYPYGLFTAKVVQAVQDEGYDEAYAVTRGDDTRLQLRRKHI